MKRGGVPIARAAGWTAKPGEEYFDQDVGHRLGVLPNRVEFFLRQFRDLIAEQFAASRKARFFGFGLGFAVDDVIHTRRWNAVAERCGP